MFCCEVLDTSLQVKLLLPASKKESSLPVRHSLACLPGNMECLTHQGRRMRGLSAMTSSPGRISLVATTPQPFPGSRVSQYILPVLSSLCTEKADCQHWAEFCISADTDWPTILLLACPYKAESHPSPPFILFISFPRYKLKLVMSTEIYLVLVLLDQFDQSNPSFS